MDRSSKHRVGATPLLTFTLPKGTTCGAIWSECVSLIAFHAESRRCFLATAYWRLALHACFLKSPGCQSSSAICFSRTSRMTETSRTLPSLRPFSRQLDDLRVLLVRLDRQKQKPDFGKQPNAPYPLGFLARLTFVSIPNCFGAMTGWRPRLHGLAATTSHQHDTLPG